MLPTHVDVHGYGQVKLACRPPPIKLDPTYRLIPTGSLGTPPPSGIATAGISTVVYDQLQEGSCVENALCTRIRALAADFEPARQYLYARARQWEGTPLTLDSGSSIYSAVHAVERWGVCSEALWPYVDDGMKIALDPGSDCDADAAKHLVLVAYQTPTLDSVLWAIAHGIPVTFGFDVYANMVGPLTAATGELTVPGAGDAFVGRHAVTAHRYDDFDAAARVLRLRCRNSWSEQWGQAGDFEMPIWYWDAGHTSDAWALLAVKVPA